MKKLFVFLSIFAFTFIQAQELSKSELKQLKAEIKELKSNPIKYKKLKESLEVREVIVDQQSEEISNLKKQLQNNELKIKSLNDSLQYVASRQVTTNTQNNTTNSQATLNHQGTKYRVQIGLFQNFSITQLFDIPKFLVHEYVDGLHRYSVGNFNSEAEAEAFKKEMMRLGIKDAFVTTYTDGVRTDNLPYNSSTTNYNYSTPSNSQKVNVAPTTNYNNSGFNVKPSQTTNYYNSNTESNPNNVSNGTVISITPPATTIKEEVEVVEEEVIEEVEEVKTNTNSTAPKSTGIKINLGK